MKPRHVTPSDYNYTMSDREKAGVAALMIAAAVDPMDVTHIEIRDTETVYTLLLRDEHGDAYMCCTGSTDVATRTVVYP